MEEFMARFARSIWTLTVAVALMAIMGSKISAQSLDSLARGVLKACKGRATCTEADHYSGTVQWAEELNADIGGGGSRSLSHRRVTINMVITSGHVECHGSVEEDRKQWSAGRLEMDTKASGRLGGPGLFRVAFDKGGTHTVMGATEDEDVELDPNTPSYDITVACPSPALTQANGGQSQVTPAEPARWGSSYEMQTYDWPGSFDQKALSGKSTTRHPDSDEANGIRGTVTITWSLTKGSLPPS
jgi:hypothetical protein